MSDDKRIINEDVLVKLVNAPSPTGYEQPAQQIVRDELKDVADTIKTDVMGNVIATLNPEGQTKIMLAGHIDEVGMQVKYITKKGFIQLETGYFRIIFDFNYSYIHSCEFRWFFGLQSCNTI